MRSIHETQLKNKLLVELNAQHVHETQLKNKLLVELNAKHSRTLLRENKNNVSTKEQEEKKEFLEIH